MIKLPYVVLPNPQLYGDVTIFKNADPNPKAKNWIRNT